jgi:plastocyanin
MLGFKILMASAILILVLTGGIAFAKSLLDTDSTSDSTSSDCKSDCEHNTEEVKIAKGSSTPSNNKYFEPTTLKVGKGTTVKWINDDSTLHTVTSGTPEGGQSGTQFDSSYMAADKTFEFTFEKAGTFKYYCTLHPYMKGKIVVSNNAPPAINLKNAEKEPSVVIDTTPNSNINVSNWSNFTDSDNRFSVQYPSHWTVTQSGNRFTNELPLVVVDANGSASKIQSQLSVNAFKSNQNFDSNDLAKYAYNQLVKQSTGSKLVEPISCNKYTVGNAKACSFLYSGDDKEGKRYGILEVAFVDDNKLNHLISYRADPSNFDKETVTMEHIVQSYKINE